MTGVHFDPWGKGDGDADEYVPPPWDDEPPPDPETEPPPDLYLAEPANDPAPFVRSWQPVDLGPVLDGTWSPPTPSVGLRHDGIPVLYPGRVHTLASETEAGKTWFALALARDELDAGNHVAYLDFEDDEGGIAGRLLALGTDRTVVLDRFHYLRPATALGTGIHRDDLAAVLTTHAPTLVVLDGVTAAMSLHGFDPISNRDVADFSRILPTAIAETGPAVLLLDHVVKASENRGRYALGAVHKLNGVTGASLLLEVVTPIRVGATGRSRLRVAKDRPGGLRRHALPDFGNTALDWFSDMVVESHGDDFVEVTLYPPDATTPTNARKRPTLYMHRVSDVLETVAEPLSLRGIQDRVTGKVDHVRTAIAALVDEGYVEAKPGPRNATLHRLVKRFDEEAS